LFQNTIGMLRRSNRKRANPEGRGDFVAPAAKEGNDTSNQHSTITRYSYQPNFYHFSWHIYTSHWFIYVSSMASMNTDTTAVISTSTTSSQSITGNTFWLQITQSYARKQATICREMFLLI